MAYYLAWCADGVLASHAVNIRTRPSDCLRDKTVVLPIPTLLYQTRYSLRIGSLHRFWTSGENER